MGQFEILKELEERVEKSLGGAEEVEEIISRLLDVQYNLTLNLEGIRERKAAPLSRTDLQRVFSVLSKVDQEKYYTHILLREMNKAISETKEYDLPVFRKRLTQAIRAPGTIKIQITDENRISVSILPGLRKNAGTLAEWLEAVKKTRDELKIGRKDKPIGGKPGSDMYEEKIYKPAREGGNVQRDYGRYTKDITEKYNKAYYDTLKSRLSNVTSLAPWWEYLEYGTDHGPATAGGRAYPHYAGTHFVAKATMQIIKGVKSTLDMLKYNRNQELRAEEEVYQRLLNRVQEALHKVQNVTVFTRAEEVNKVSRVVNGAITTWLKQIRTGKYKGRKLSIQAQLEATDRLRRLYTESIAKGELISTRMRGSYRGELIDTRTVAMWNDLIVPNLEMLGVKVGKVN